MKEMRERLIELRQHFDMSQREFAKPLGMAQSTYAPLENGKRYIREAYIKLICQSYGVNELWFREGIGNMFTEQSDKQLQELLNVFDTLSPELQKLLLKQAKDLKSLQDELSEK